MTHLKRPLAAIAFSLAVAVGGAEALAGDNCPTRAEALDLLKNKYGETWRGGGVAGDGAAMFEMWASDVTGTWTILRTDTDGKSCSMAEGDGWRDGQTALEPPITNKHELAPLSAPPPPPKPVSGRPA